MITMKYFDKKQRISAGLFTLLIIGTSLPGQNVKKDADTVSSLMASSQYRKALKKITERLDKIYSSRVEDKRIPSEFISLKNTREDIDLKRLFRERKARGFFIEENPTLSRLHFQAGRCYHELKKYNKSITHYLQSLRFKKIEPYKDDRVYYGMARAFFKGNRMNAYYRHLEAASHLNPEKYEYSRELALALSHTREKRKALYHLTRFLGVKGKEAAPKLYLLAGTLYEETDRYLEAEKYYRKYLELKPENGEMHFALGVIAMKRTGNYSLARKSLLAASEKLPKDDILRRARINEYMGDMALHDRKFKSAVKHYGVAIKYHEKVKEGLDAMEKNVAELGKKINGIKADLLRTQNYDRFEEYEFLRSEKGKKELELKKIKLNYEKLNSGRLHWNTAYSLERRDKLKEAIVYYRKSIFFDYKTNRARKKIIKLKLKIKRGY